MKKVSEKKAPRVRVDPPSRVRVVRVTGSGRPTRWHVSRPEPKN
jgi:hypothetical protein